jgi:hypothetical protein
VASGLVQPQEALTELPAKGSRQCFDVPDSAFDTVAAWVQKDYLGDGLQFDASQVPTRHRLGSSDSLRHVADCYSVLKA